MNKKIRDKIDELRVFLISDMFYFVTEEMKNERDLIEYLSRHFSILEDSIDE